MRVLKCVLRKRIDETLRRVSICRFVDYEFIRVRSDGGKQARDVHQLGTNVIRYHNVCQWRPYIRDRTMMSGALPRGRNGARKATYEGRTHEATNGLAGSSIAPSVSARICPVHLAVSSTERVMRRWMSTRRW